MPALDSNSCGQPKGHRELYVEIANELFRLRAERISMSVVVPAGDERYELVTVSFGRLNRTVMAEGLRDMLRTLPDASGERAVIRKIRKSASYGEPWAAR